MCHEKACCFTGHRFLPKDNIEKICTRVQSIIDLLYSQGVRHFYNGGAIGFDLLTAQIVIDTKRQLEDIQLHMVLPYKKQAQHWKEKDKQQYDAILQAADTIEYITDEYVADCMHRRNRRMVEQSDYCIAYLTKITGGTYYTFHYAKKKGIRVINIANTL